MTEAQKWLLLSYTLPREPSAPRVARWRKLKKLGAILLHDALWVLPSTPTLEEQVRWLATEIAEADGSAEVWHGHLDLATRDGALVEQFVAGVDIAVSVVDLGEGPAALPAVEISPSNGVYDYAARYTAGLTTWHAPARLAPAVTAEVAEIAIEAHNALGLRDLSRVDLIVSPDGTAQVLEVNVAPGMTETSLLPMAVAAANLDLGKVLATLATRAVERG